MEPALDVIGRALYGDSGAQAFLERTSSIYVLDVTDTSSPKIYGCWNFIHQALNEVERYESKRTHNASGQSDDNGGSVMFVPHVRLLATMALRVARRSPQSDRSIVATCLSNASDFQCSASQAQWLYDLNSELREFVMGRIAAMAFDFSFYNRTHESSNLSAFADQVVVDTFCAILAANAVAAGPVSVRDFATEWIIPSSRNIPTLALISVVHHLALEGTRPEAPAGTKDMLQQLSVPISSMVVLPAMTNAVADDSENKTADSFVLAYATNLRILANALTALDAWCEATALTLPQVRHISSKVRLDIVNILNDAMCTDSPQVIGALADLIDHAVHTPTEEVSDDRMNQVRHVIQVNELAFKANFSPDHLRIIEAKEMALILEQLCISIGLQRARFVESQREGDVVICLNLARIGRDIFSAWFELCRDGGQKEPDKGLVAFLFEASSHPSMNVCAVALSASSQFVSNSSLAKDLLPLLQRKAIIPHRIDESGVPMLVVDRYGSSVHEFLQFRECVIAGALATCWKYDSQGYMDSCSSAIEEFCSDQDVANLSFHLEAALFCIECLGSLLTDQEPKAFYHQLNSCVESLSRKPSNLTSNPLTLVRLSIFLQKLARWFHENQQTDAAGDLAAASLSYSLVLSGQAHAKIMIRNADVSPVYQACHALQMVLSCAPGHFADEHNLRKTISVWHSLYSDLESFPQVLETSPQSIADCIGPLGKGLCIVILHAREDLRSEAFDSLVEPLIESIDDILSQSRVGAHGNNLVEMEQLVERISAEISLIATFIHTFTCASEVNRDYTILEGGTCIPRCSKVDFPLYVSSTIRRWWPSIAAATAEYCRIPKVSESICRLLSELVPAQMNDDSKMVLLRDITALVLSMVEMVPDHPFSFSHICKYLEALVLVLGQQILESPEAVRHKEVTTMFKSLLLQLVTKARHCLGLSWMEENQQQEGEQAFESRPVPKLESSCQCLGPLLSLMQEMIAICPTFLLSIPAHWDADEFLIWRITTQAVCALSAADPALVWSSIRFLESMIRVIVETASETEIGAQLKDNLSRVRAGIIRRMLAGCCGKYDHGLLEPASKLLWHLAREFPDSFQSDVTSALQHENIFLLGDDAKRCFIARLCENCIKEGTTWSFMDSCLLIEKVWELHRTGDVAALPWSDAVLRFLKKYVRNVT